MWQAQIFTLYPDIFPGPLSKGLYGKALSNKLWDLKVVNIRDAAEDKHKTVDDTPFGGGSGMLLKADVLANSIDQNVKKGERIFYLSPKGKIFDQKLSFVDAYANLNRLSLEVFHLHSIYPLLIGLGINDEGDIEWRKIGFYYIFPIKRNFIYRQF